jgi:DNA repair photolyase
MTSNELSNAGVKKPVAPALLPEKNALITEAQLKNGSAKPVHHHGNCIYMPNGKAREYCTWACNLYNGCINVCAYCYNNDGIMKYVLGGNNVRLKKSLVDETTAYEIFCNELNKFRGEIINNGGALHFNFVSDPCLPETIDLNWKCIDYAIRQGVTCQVLTKRADWLGHPSVQNALSHPELLRVGFSLTGCDELEPGASPNEERIHAMCELHNAGIATWASIEPIIDPQKSLQMIRLSLDCCDHYKIGVLSGKKSYTPDQIRQFVNEVNSLNPRSVYWKDSLLDFIHATRNQMME